MKAETSIISQHLTHVIDLFFIQCVVPDDLKSARVVPIFKTNDKNNLW